MNINEYTNFKSKTIAEFTVEIKTAENLMKESLKKRDTKTFLKVFKYKLQLEKYLRKKLADGRKYGYDSHKRNH